MGKINKLLRPLIVILLQYTVCVVCVYVCEGLLLQAYSFCSWFSYSMVDWVRCLLVLIPVIRQEAVMLR